MNDLQPGSRTAWLNEVFRPESEDESERHERGCCCEDCVDDLAGFYGDGPC